MSTVLITGAAKRIGRAIALSLAKQGWDIAIHYHHSAEDAESVADQIRAQGRKAITIKADLAQEAQVQAIIPQAVAQLGPLSCLVNNASSFENDRLESNDRASWDAHMEVNLRAPVVLMQHFARQLPAESEGNIINILDYAVLKPPHHFLSYFVSKTGLWTLTQTLALELAPRIRVNGIGPGPALANSRQTPSCFAASCEQTPLKRGTTPEEICHTVQFLLSSPSITGQMIALDGGRHLEGAEYS